MENKIEKINDLVVKSNSLIEAMTDLSLQQQRLLALIISKLPRLQTIPEDRPYKLEVSVKDFADSFNLSTKNAYNEIEKNQDILQKKIVELKEDDKRIKVSIFILSEYYDGEGIIKVEIHNVLLPYLVNLKERFTQYRIKDVYQFSSMNTWRVYELLAQYKNIGKRYLSIDEIRWTLNLENKYKKSSDLKYFVIEPSIKSINQVSDLQVSYETQKRGRKVVGYNFTIEQKEKSFENGDIIDLKKSKGKTIEKQLDLNFLDLYPNTDIQDLSLDEQKKAIYTALKRIGVYDGPTNKIVESVIEQELDYKKVIVEKINVLTGRYKNLKKKNTTFAGYVKSVLYKELNITNEKEY